MLWHGSISHREIKEKTIGVTSSVKNQFKQIYLLLKHRIIHTKEKIVINENRIYAYNENRIDHTAESSDTVPEAPKLQNQNQN